MKTRRRLAVHRSSLVSLAVGAGALFANLGWSGAASAQQLAGAFPFPSTNVENGVTTSVLTSHELRDLYRFWRDAFIEDCGNDMRVRYPESGNDTRSEGVGYGMVIAAYMGDFEVFDGLWNYYQRASDGQLMHWRRNGCDAGGGGGDNGSAADADIDAAFGLIVANRQFPGQGYAQDAAGLVAAIRTRLFQNGCQGILTAGSQFSDCGCINPSYIPPGYYTSFGEVDQAGFWNNARNASYAYFAAVSNNNTGLVPAWSNSNGGTNLSGACTPQVAGGGQPNEFQADAARTPWRVAADYLWTGDPRAQTFLADIAGFANDQRIVQIVDRYSLQGQALNGNGNGAALDATGFRSTFTMGGFATAMTAMGQNDIDEFTGAWQSLYRPGDNIGAGGQELRAFNSSLALLYGLTVTGFAWDPAGDAPGRVTEPALNPAGGNLLDNGDFDEGLLGWEMGVFGAGASEAFAMHRDGEMRFRMQEVQTDEPYNIQFFQAVNVQPNQNYKISVTARAAAARQLRIVVGQQNEPYTAYGSLLNRRGEEPEVMLSTEAVVYDTVFRTPAAVTGPTRFAVQLGDSLSEVIIDDISLAPTDEPVSEVGDLIGVEPPPGQEPPAGEGDPDSTPQQPGGQDPVGGTPGEGAPGGGGTPGGGTPGGGTPSGGTPSGGTPSGGTPSGGVPPSPDLGTTGQLPGSDLPTGGAPPAISSGAPPLGASAPATPTGAPASPPAPGVRCSPQGTECAPYLCSPGLGLCYDRSTGYVWNPNTRDWRQPPEYGCGATYVFLPGTEACYDPATGYYYDQAEMTWKYWGDNYSEGPDPVPVDGDGCSVSAAGRGDAERGAWLAVGLLGAAFALRRRRNG